MNAICLDHMLELETNARLDHMPILTHSLTALLLDKWPNTSLKKLW